MSVDAVEQALVARLEATVKAAGLVRQVYAMADYAAIPEASLVTPSLAVIYTGYAVGARPAATIQDVELGWLVVINARSALASASGAGARTQVAPIFDAVLEALLGFRPIPKFRPLQLAPAPGAALTDAGAAYYPIAFTTTAPYRAT